MTPAAFDAFKLKLAAASLSYSPLEDGPGVELSVEVEGAQQMVRLVPIPNVPFMLSVSVTHEPVSSLSLDRLRAVLSKAQEEVFVGLQSRRVPQGEFLVATAVIHEDAVAVEFHERITGCARLAWAVAQIATVGLSSTGGA